MNSQTEKLFGYQREELIHQTLEVLLPERFRGQHQGHRAQFFASPRCGRWGMLWNCSVGGRMAPEFPADIALSPIETEDGIVVFGAVRDMTERKQAEKIMELNAALQRQLAEQNAQLESAKNELAALKERERGGGGSAENQSITATGDPSNPWNGSESQGEMKYPKE